MDFSWEKCIDISEMFVYITRPGASLKNPDTWLHHHHDFMSTTTLVTCVQHHLDHEGPELPELSLRHVAQDVALVVNHRSGKKCSFRKKEDQLREAYSYYSEKNNAPRALVSEKNTAPRTKHRAWCPIKMKHRATYGHLARCLV